MSDKGRATRSQKHFGRKKISLSSERNKHGIVFFIFGIWQKKNMEMASKVSYGNLVSVLAQNLYWTKNLGSKRVLSVDQLSSPESALPRLPLMK